jgi:chromosome segregation protein
VGELRVAFVTLQGETESHARQLERLGELERELSEIGGRRRDEIARAERDLERYAAELEAAAERAMNLAQQLAGARSKQNEIGVQLDTQRGSIDAEQERLHEIEKARTRAAGPAPRRRDGSVGVQAAPAEPARPHLRELPLERGRASRARVRVDRRRPGAGRGAHPRLKEEIARLGPVNLLALEEHEEKAARLEFLEAQRQDLIQASASLTETIEKINRTAHFLFMETFEQIRGHFRDTIITVFDGGEAIWCSPIRRTRSRATSRSWCARAARRSTP